MHLDTREGLEENITLQWHNFTKVQILDYEGVPFRCRRCHKVRHLFKECPLVQKPPEMPMEKESGKGRATTNHPKKTTSAAPTPPRKATPA